ncbi:thioredoxin-like protein [Pilobolus umbonatus]|nr:thioredoxin-like protein [Pilobolus umbonatus]
MAGSVVEVKNAAEFKDILSNNKLVVVDFHATWCGPCKLIAPKITKLAEEKSNIKFIKVDVDEVADIASQYEIRAMPTIMFFVNGEKVNEVIGANFANILAALDSLPTA